MRKNILNSSFSAAASVSFHEIHLSTVTIESKITSQKIALIESGLGKSRRREETFTWRGKIEKFVY